ncbi:uncharacterized protein LOC126381569 [Pectinophora gossypiella]|uniref:uncharacterized protein LOC126381569 n=1 Tax=Pectinophora gossypiella TaxID=13191 RepID=UPI00214EE715|nr:uncharacterized protein LOC126381569 [Pectinophora gossypiella]
MKWEESRNDLSSIPTLAHFNKFLIDRADVLEAINRNKYENSNSSKAYPQNQNSSRSSSANNNNYKQQSNNNYNKQNRVSDTKSFAATNQTKSNNYLCVICDGNHRIYDCSTFKAKSMQERLADVARYKLCTNCLRQGHPTQECKMGPCRECKQRHNSLLHKSGSTLDSHSAVCQSETSANFTNQNCEVILSTALIQVSNPRTSETVEVRALLDCGSQSSFITKSLKNKLSLNSNPTDPIKVIGIGNNCTNNIVENCTAKVQSLNSPFNVTMSYFVLKEITSNLPKMPIDLQMLNLPKDLQLADPKFYQPAPVEMLIGADLFWDILGNEQQNLGPNYPKLHNSKFGWLISGPVKTQNIHINKNTKNIQNNKIHCNHALINNTLQNNMENILTKFWEIEEVPQKPKLNENDKICERHFINNTYRLNTGRFCVRLPLVDSPDCLGDTYHLAKRRFLNLEKKFKRNSSLKVEYSKFIKEYADLGHLSQSENLKPPVSYFLCHHAVLRENSESTKLRVVFDGSAPSSSGYSLNDILMVGPNVQDSLFSILIRARQYKYLLTGDIEKMYRQVEVHNEDRDLQLILWREDESQPIRTLRLNTLTYGTASASYLSTRCLWQVGEEAHDDLIKTIIQKDLYVDDLITGSNDENELHYIKKSVSNELKAACLNLRKYKSNLPSLIQDIDLQDQENLTLSSSSCALGLGWNPKSDNLHFPYKEIPYTDKITKRHIMSNSFKIFDPLGLLSPYIIQPKILLQKLWQQKYDWDEPISHNIKKEWENFCKNITYLSDLNIPRPVLCDLPKQIEIHTFSDASQSAYGACIYMRSVNSNDDVTVKLLCAKSKVAPIKQQTIPRLELCAALLSARLCRAVTESLRYKPSRIVHWCDSSIVLAWMKSDNSKLKTFAANRITEILELTQASSWRYVPTASNPADLISRGVDASRLVRLDLWWSGPTFLTKDESQWPILNNNTFVQLPEIKSNPSTIDEPIISFERYSKLNKLQHCFAYVKRFIYNLKNPNNKRLGNLSLNELKESFHSLCILAQKQSLPNEYNVLLNNKPLNSKSKICSLSPFLDNDRLIRVGGRIEASNYSYEKKHPILLLASHHLTKLYFEREHLRTMHAGPQLLLSEVREAVWPVNGRHLARRTVNKCVRCRRVVGRTLCPMMGNLPSQRITPNFPFLSVGLDFAGPFYIINRKGRGSKVIKCYLCLFICLRYKCLHLEAVSDLTKEAFIMTLRRFISRRGKPAEIFCDNGRNFVAAAKEINSFFKLNFDPLSQFANEEGIQFIFTPTYAPHFGGIWEAGVKSAKYHIKRVMGNSHLTFEEITTLFAQVEAILNSRPLCPLSTSPDDLLSLSPGHFLVGRPLAALPSPALEDVKENGLKRYARLEQIRQIFWQRWQKEYISELQQRTKWKTNTTKLNVGDLVLLQEDHVPPLSWRLGRVARLFPGPDGISRVADIKITRGCVRRPLVRLCPLPAAEDFNS